MYDWLLIFGVVLWLGVAAWYVRQPIASAFHPITYYLIFHGVLFTIRPLLAWQLGYTSIYASFQFQPSMDEKSTVLVAADLALVVFVAVAARVGNLAFAKASLQERGQPVRLDTALWLTMLLCVPLAVASLSSSLGARTAGVSTMVMVDGISINTTSNGYFTDAVLMLGPLVALFAWAGRFRPWALAPAILFVFAKAGTGGRWPFVMTAMSLALFWMYDRRLRWPPARVLLLIAVPLLLLFTIVGEDRGAGVRRLVVGGSDAAVANDYFQQRPLESMDYGNMEFFEYLVYTIPKRTGTYDWFLFNLQIVTEPVPRVLWPGKPVGSPVKMFSLEDYGRPTGMSLSLPGTGWFEAGWIGVVAWTALFAWAYGRLYNWFVRSDQSRVKVALFLIMLPISLQTFRDGVLLTVLKTSFFPLLPILLWFLFNRLLNSWPRLRPVESGAA